ncbi:hypothetical protein Tco_1467497 [Tanacetum coccineum]
MPTVMKLTLEQTHPVVLVMKLGKHEGSEECKRNENLKDGGEVPVPLNSQDHKGVGKPFHTQKGSLQQADDYLPQSMSWSFNAVNLDDP